MGSTSVPDSQNIARSHDETFPLGLPTQQLNPMVNARLPWIPRAFNFATISVAERTPLLCNFLISADLLSSLTGIG
jgi:hypothetical protein